MRRTLCLSVALLVSTVVTSRASAPQSSDDLVKKLSAPMHAVAVLLVREQWDPRLDDLVQRAPSAAPLGPRWTPALPAWQRARSGITSREEAVLAAYAKSSELSETLRSSLDKYFPAADATALVALLNGPGGPAIIRYQASSEFAVTSMGADPMGPKPGDPKWLELLKSLRQRFNERVGPAVPADDPAHQNDVITFISTPAASKFQQLWMSVVGKAKITLDTGMNLMVFDNREAIVKEIAAAVATVK